MRVGKTLRGVGLGAAVLLALAACGSGDSGSEASEGGSSPTTANEATTSGTGSSATTPSSGESTGSTGSGGGSQEPLKLGYVLPETGDLAYLGPPQIEAAKYARSVINKDGGVLGKKVPQLVGGDEANDAAIASQSADRVLGSGVDAIIGAAASGMSLAIIDKVTSAHVVQCSGSNTAPTFTTYKDGGYYFRTAPSDAMQGPVLANLMITDGHSQVALVGRGDDYGKGLVNATAKALKSAGAQVVAKVIYDPKATDFSATVQKIVSAKPDAVGLVTFEEGKQIIKGLIEAGIPADALYGTDGLRSEELPKLVAPDNPAVLAGMKGTAPASASNPAFIKNLKKFAPKLKELQYAPQVYDCVMTIALAADAAQSTDPEVFKDKMVDVTKDGTKCDSYEKCSKLLASGKDIDYQGVSGPLDFTKPGEPGKATIEVYGYNKKGELHTLGTKESSLE